MGFFRRKKLKGRMTMILHCRSSDKPRLQSGQFSGVWFRNMLIRSVRRLCSASLRTVPKAQLPAFTSVPLSATAGLTRFNFQQPLMPSLIRTPSKIDMDWSFNGELQGSTKENSMQLDSVMRKRKKKMKKHKLRKRRKREKAEKRKLSQGR